MSSELVNIHDFIKRNSVNTEEERIEESIHDLLESTKFLYISVNKAKTSDNIDSFNDHLMYLKNASTYLERAIKDIDAIGNSKKARSKNVVIFPVSNHTINQSRLKVGGKMNRFFSGLPLANFDEIGRIGKTLWETPSISITFTLVGSIFSLLFGGFTVFTYVFMLLNVAHFIMRQTTTTDNKARYILKNVQIAIWSYFWLAVGNAMGYVVQVPQGALTTLVLLGLIYYELKGVVENAKLAGLWVPPILEQILKKNLIEKDLNPKKGKNNTM